MNERCRQYVVSSRFTLLELLVSMAVLSIVMALLFWFVSSTQNAWDYGDATARIYENSRAIFEIIERDLHTAVLSDEPGNQIKLHIGTPIILNSQGTESQEFTNYGDDLHFCCVSATEPHDAATSRLCEISYKHHTNAGDLENQFVLRRQIVSDNDTANWNCLNPAIDWFENNNIGADAQLFEKVADGVAEFEVLFFDSDGNRLPGGSIASYPSQVVINIVLFDEDLKTMVPEVRLKTQRAFSKIFYLSHLQEPDS